MATLYVTTHDGGRSYKHAIGVEMGSFWPDMPDDNGMALVSLTVLGAFDHS